MLDAIEFSQSEAPRLKTGLLKDFSVLEDFIPQTP